MSVLNKTAQRKKKTFLVNSTKELIKRFTKFDGKTLLDIDASEPLIDIKLATKEWEGNTIMNLVLEYKDMSIAFPLSKSFGVLVEEDETSLLDGEFYLRNLMTTDPETGMETPTGDDYFCFGKPSGLSFDEVHSLAAAEVVAEEETEE